MFKKLDTKKYVRLYYVFPNISGISFQWTYTLWKNVCLLQALCRYFRSEHTRYKRTSFT